MKFLHLICYLLCTRCYINCRLSLLKDVCSGLQSSDVSSSLPHGIEFFLPKILTKSINVLSNTCSCIIIVIELIICQRRNGYQL